MNRIILIGNGFDLAHGLKTSYADFIDWYWDKRVSGLQSVYSDESKDILCSLKLLPNTIPQWQSFYWNNYEVLHSTPGKEIIKQLAEDKTNYRITKSKFFSCILRSYQEKGWVDIENEYYRLLFPPAGNGPFPYKDKPSELNEQLAFIRALLIEYLTTIQKGKINKSIVKQSIKKQMFAPFKKQDIAVGNEQTWNDMMVSRCDYDRDTWLEMVSVFSVDANRIGINHDKVIRFVEKNRDAIRNSSGKEYDAYATDVAESFFLPDRIMLLDFNYTNTVELYGEQNDKLVVNHIHGELSCPGSVIFGYGDELDENYKKMSEKNENEYLRNIKSVKYLESPNYRYLLGFIESSPYQIYIMGHSCGNSDRTLLNSLFEHKNCVSIKPFYHVKEDGTDNYMDLVQNISRNFTDMKLMRNRVVNKTFCETF
jgi:hypothetical protein